MAHALFLYLLIQLLLPTVRMAPLARAFVPALLYKILMGWLMGAIFTYYYGGGDTLHYFSDAGQLAQLAYRQPLEYLRVLLGWQAPPSTLVYLNQPRALFFDKLVSVVAIISYHNYWIASVYFSLLSFGGCWKLANALSRCYPRYQVAATVALLFYPSVAFWSAGILKESVAVAAITFMVYQTLRLDAGSSSWRQTGGRVLSLLVAAWVLWQLKYYYAGVLIASLLSVVLGLQVAKRLPAAVTLGAVLVSWIGGGVLISFLPPLLGIDRLAALLLHKHDTMALLSDSSYMIHFTALDGSFVSFVMNAPWALFSAMFRPLIGEGSTFLQWMAALENTVLLLLAGGALAQLPRYKVSPRARWWVLVSFLYITTLGVMLAFASPNFGSLVRYRVAFLPFLVYFILIGNPWLTSGRLPRLPYHSPTKVSRA
jgi:hypothetical protein